MADSRGNGASVAAEAEDMIMEAARQAVHMCTFKAQNLQERLDNITKEYHKLVSDNTRLQQENERLRAEIIGGMPDTGRPGATARAPKRQFKFRKAVSDHRQAVHSVAITPTDGSRNVMATASWDKTVHLYDLNNMSSLRPMRTLGNPVSEEMGGLYAVGFAKTAPDILGCTSEDNKVHLWNWKTGTYMRALGGQNGHESEVNGIDFHTSQQVMVTASDDTKAIIWDFAEGINLRTLEKHEAPVYGAKFLGEEHQYLVATCCFDQLGRIFDMRDRNVVQTLKGHIDDVIGIDYSTVRSMLATGSDDGRIILWDPRTSWSQFTVIDATDWIPDHEIKRVKFSLDGQYLAAGGSGGTVLIYDIDKLRSPPVQLGGHSECVFDLAWGVTPNRQNILASASHDATCRIWMD